MLKKILPLFLIAAILVNVLGIYPVFKVKQAIIRSAIKKEMKKGVPKSELHEITFEIFEKIDWTKPSKEFRIGDRLYDVVYRKVENGKLVYQCINDKEEAKLFAELDKMVIGKSRSNDTQRGLLNLSSKYFSNYIINEKKSTNFNFVFHSLEKSNYLVHFYFIYKTIPSPPPKFS